MVPVVACTPSAASLRPSVALPAAARDLALESGFRSGSCASIGIYRVFAKGQQEVEKRIERCSWCGERGSAPT